MQLPQAAQQLQKIYGTAMSYGEFAPSKEERTWAMLCHLSTFST
jgi:hypothetical protein